jgi:hypothetical protein
MSEEVALIIAMPALHRKLLTAKSLTICHERLVRIIKHSLHRSFTPLKVLNNSPYFDLLPSRCSPEGYHLLMIQSQEIHCETGM